jgi:hypothetical protein
MYKQTKGNMYIFPRNTLKINLIYYSKIALIIWINIRETELVPLFRVLVI